MPRNKAVYEWCVEMCDIHGDIIDLEFSDELADLEYYWKPKLEMPDGVSSLRIVLRRGFGNESVVYVIAFEYAYPEDNGGELPERFDAGSKVPKKYQKEWIDSGSHWRS